MESVSLHMDEPKGREALEKRHVELLNLVDTLGEVSGSDSWKNLHRIEFEGAVERIEKEMLLESKKVEVSPQRLYFLQGELKWAKKYADLDSYRESKLVELANVKQQLNNGK